MVPLNLTYLHCLQHSLFEHFFNLYYLQNGSPQTYDLWITIIIKTLHNISMLKCASATQTRVYTAILLVYKRTIEQKGTTQINTGSLFIGNAVMIIHIAVVRTNARFIFATRV